MRLLKSFVVVVVLTLMIAACMQVLVPSIAHASTSYMWIGSGDPGSWTDPGNWSPYGVPGAGDSATIMPTQQVAYPAVSVPTGTTVQNLTLVDASDLMGGSLTITGSFNWTTNNNPGDVSTSITVPSSGTANISGNWAAYIDSGYGSPVTFNLAGTTTVSGTALTTIGSQTTVTNTGTFTIEPGAEIYAQACCAYVNQFINQGTVVVPASTTTAKATINGIAFDDQGSVSIGSNSSLELQIAPSTFAANVSFTGAGTLLIDNNANVQLSGTVNLGSGTTFNVGLDQNNSAGTLSGTGTLTGSGGLFSWTGGTVEGTFTIAGSVSTTISGNQQKLLFAPNPNSNTTLTLAGSTTLSSGSTLTFGGNVDILTNTGTFTPQAGSTITAQSCCVNPSQFNNTGTLTVNVGLGKTFSISSVAFNNSGTVNLNSGTLQFGDPGYTQTAGSTKLSGGTIASTDTANAIVTLNGGSLTGKGTITSTVQNAALIDPGSTVPGEGLITIVGNYTQTSKGTLREDIKGTGSPGTNYDQLSVNGMASLNGTLNIQTASSFTPKSGNQFTVVKATTLTGKFATLLNYKLKNGLVYQASYTKTAATLTVK